MTAAVDLSKGKVPFTKITDTQQRLNQYVQSIKYAIDNYTIIDTIVFCDNTNFLFDYGELYRRAKRNHKTFEVLLFTGDKKRSQEKGKGYGEGEIIKFALENSKYLKNSKFFYKLTGRLIVKNFNFMEKKKSTDNCFIFYPRELYGGQTNFVSTILYKVNVEFYNKFLIDKYRDVNDYKGKYLEHVFCDSLIDKKEQIDSFGTFPRISGLSGSSGELYDISRLKFFIEKQFTYFGVHNIQQNFGAKLIIRMFCLINKIKNSQKI